MLMSFQKPIVTQSVFEDSGWSHLARVKGPSGSLITQAGTTSISLKVYDKSTGTIVGSEYTLTVANVVYDTLQTDARWTEDATGYNFRYDAAATVLPDGGKTYVCEYLFTPASGAAFHVVFETPTRALYRS